MNVIELVKKYLPVLDEQYRQLSKTAILDMPKEWVKDTRDAKKVKIAKYKTDKLGGYSRANGFVKGSMELSWEEHEFTQDRGRSIQVDHEDNEETFGMAFGRLAGRFQKDAVIPELDAYRLAVYATKAGHKGTLALGTDSVLRKIDHIDALMDDEEVPEEGRIIFLRPSVYEEVINDASIEKKLEVNDEMTKALNKKIYSYNNHPLIKVTSKRMYTKIKLLDGQTSGEEEGGYEKAADGADLGLLMVNQDAVVQISKRAVARIWAPSREYAAGTDGVNPDADAWKFDFRVYHDAWVLEEKVNGIAALTLTDVEPTAEELFLNTEDCTLEFTVGDTFSSEGLKATAKFTDGTYSDVSSDVEVTAPDMTTAGVKEVEVAYGEVTASYNIEVKSA